MAGRSYRLELWRCGISGQSTEVHPLRSVQALIRYRSAPAVARERQAVMTDIAVIVEAGRNPNRKDDNQWQS